MACSDHKERSPVVLRVYQLYQRFIEGFSHIARPLFNLTKAKSVFKWSIEEKLAFDTLKDRITSAPILALPDNTTPYHVEADSSDFTTRAVYPNRAWKTENGTQSPFCLSPCPPQNGTLRYMTKKCWPLFKPWRNGGTSQKEWNIKLRFGCTTKTWSIS